MSLKYGAFANKMTGHAASAAASTTTNVIISLPIDQIDENPLNEKIFKMDEIDSIAERMKTKGDTDPIRVRKKEDGRYEVEEGHRRLRAHIKNGDKKIDCILGNEKDNADVIDSLVMSNLTARDLTPLEMARAMQLWVEESLPAFREKEGLTGKTNDILSAKVGMSVRSVARIRSLLKLIPEVQKLLDEGSVDYTAVLSLTQLDAEKQKAIYDDMVSLFDSQEAEVTATDIQQIIDAQNPSKGSPKKKKETAPRVKSTIGRGEKAVIDLLTITKKKPLTEESIKIVSDNINDDDIDNLKEIRRVIDAIIKART